MERMPLTSTCLMRLPTTSFSRSRLSVSTSGSSGIGGHLIRRALAGGGEGAPRHLGGGLLGLLLRPALARPALLVPEIDGGEEALGVVRPLLLHDVAREGVEALG